MLPLLLCFLCRRSEYLELEAHDRTTIDLPQVQHDLAKAVLALGKPLVLFLMNAGAVAIDAEAAHGKLLFRSHLSFAPSDGECPFICAVQRAGNDSN